MFDAVLDTDNNLHVVWEWAASQDGYREIHYQMFDSSGEALAPFTVLVNGTSIANPRIVSHPNHLGVTWTDLGGNASGIYYKYKALNSTPTNTPSGENITVSLDGGTTLTFADITAPGNTTVTTSSTGPTPPSGFTLASQTVFYDITTTAAYTAPITVCLPYDPAQHSELNPARLLHYENDAWVDVTTSNDTINHVVCGQVNSLSPFVVAKKNFTFLGFFQPVDRLPTLNSAKAGQAIPIKWSIKNSDGSYISNFASLASYGYSSPVSCSGSTDAIEQYISAGSTTLHYDTTANQFVLTSKTDKAWAGTCRTFTLVLSDGTRHQAKFQFTR